MSAFTTRAFFIINNAIPERHKSRSAKKGIKLRTALGASFGHNSMSRGPKVVVITTFPFVGGSKTYTDDIVEVFQVRGGFGRRRGPVCPSIVEARSPHLTLTEQTQQKHKEEDEDGVRRSSVLFDLTSSRS